LAAAVAVPAAAQDVFPLADDPVLATLLGEALGTNPDLRMARESVAAAEARIPQAAAPPDPTFAIGYENGGRGLGLGSDEDTGLTLSVRQELPWPGKRRLARRVVERQAEQAARQLDRARLSLVFRVRKAYADLLLARENLAIIEDQRRATRDIEELTRSRYAVSLAGQSDVLRPQAELARLEQMRVHEEGLETSAVAELNRLLGRAAGTPIPPGTRLTLLDASAVRVPSVDEVTARAEASSPEIAAARSAIESARAAVDLARRNLKPDLMASASYTNRGPLPGMWGVELGIVAPVYAGRKQKAAVAEAEANLRAAEAGLESARLRARATAEKSLADFRAAVFEGQAYAKGVLIVNGLAVQSTLASYQAGKVPFVTVLEAHNTSYRDRWEYAELLFHVLWHAAALDELAAAE
jgi:outer membrane protein TolC